MHVSLTKHKGQPGHSHSLTTKHSHFSLKVSAVKNLYPLVLAFFHLTKGEFSILGIHFFQTTRAPFCGLLRAVLHCRPPDSLAFMRVCGSAVKGPAPGFPAGSGRVGVGPGSV